MEKIAVLLNPSAGKGKSLKKRGEIEQHLRQATLHYDLFVSDSEEHLRQLAGRAVRDYRAVIAVGGDTTFKIIAAEILKYSSLDRQSPAPVLGMIGTGSANDIARSLKIRVIKDLCTAVREKAIRDMDVGCLRVKGREEPLWFLGSLSAGLGITVNRCIESYCQHHPGLAKFSLTGQVVPGMLAIHHSFSHRLVPLEADIEANGTSRRISFSLLVFANIPFYANGLHFHPGISPFDGKLDAVVIYTNSFWQTLRFGLRVNRQRHLREKGFEKISSPAFRLTCAKPLDIQLDGDIITGLESFEISLLPGALQVFSLAKN